MSKKYSPEKRCQIANTINSVTSYECIYEIGKIVAQDTNVKNDPSKYTINQNGFYVMSGNLTDTTFRKLDDFIKNKMDDYIEEDEDETETYKGSVFNNLSEDNTETESAIKNNIRMSSKEKKFIQKINKN